MNYKFNIVDELFHEEVYCKWYYILENQLFYFTTLCTLLCFGSTGTILTLLCETVSLFMNDLYS